MKLSRKGGDGDSPGAKSIRHHKKRAAARGMKAQGIAGHPGKLKERIQGTKPLKSASKKTIKLSRKMNKAKGRKAPKRTY